MSRRQIRVVGAMLENEPGKYLITQRSKKSSLPMLWEFPGGRVQGDESDEEALARELKERLALDVVVDEEVSRHEHAYDDYDVEFVVFHCKLKDPKQPVDHSKVNDHRWVSIQDLGDYEFPAADAQTVAKLLGLDG